MRLARTRGKALLIALMPICGSETARRRAWLELLLSPGGDGAEQELGLCVVLAATPEEAQRLLELHSAPSADLLFALLVPEELPAARPSRTAELVFLERSWMRGLDRQLAVSAPDSYLLPSGQRLEAALHDPSTQASYDAGEAWIPPGRGFDNHGDSARPWAVTGSSGGGESVVRTCLTWEMETRARLVAGLRELRQRAGYDLSRASAASVRALGSAQATIDAWIRAEGAPLPAQVALATAQALERVEKLPSSQRESRSKVLSQLLSMDQQRELREESARFRKEQDDYPRPCHTCGMASMPLVSRRFADFYTSPGEVPSTATGAEKK